MNPACFWPGGLASPLPVASAKLRIFLPPESDCRPRLEPIRNAALRSGGTPLQSLGMTGRLVGSLFSAGMKFV